MYALVPLSAGAEAIPEANRFVIARVLMENAPYYLSHDSAFEIHNMLTRPVTTVTITSPRRLRNRVIIKVPYRFIYASRDDLWGVIPTWVTPNEQVQVSNMERTILDGLSRPDLCSGISEVATGLWLRKDDLDWEKLTLYCKKLGNQAVAKRLGYLLELYGLGLSQVNQLQEMVGPSYALLDPTLVVDRFHVAENYRECVDNLRKQECRRLKKELSEAEYADIQGVLWPIRKNSENLTTEEQKKLALLCEYSPALKLAYTFREELTSIFELPLTKEEAREQIITWQNKVSRSALTCFDKFLTTLNNWLDKIVNYFDGRFSSGFVEGLNNKIKTTKRRCYGILRNTTLFQRLYLDIEGYRSFA